MLILNPQKPVSAPSKTEKRPARSRLPVDLLDHQVKQGAVPERGMKQAARKRSPPAAVHPNLGGSRVIHLNRQPAEQFIKIFPVLRYASTPTEP